MSSTVKKIDVPLEEALEIAGSGFYTNYVIFTAGFVLLAGMLDVEAMAMVLPAAGCDLKLTSTEKGVLNSMTLAGMLFTGPVSGFLADAYGRKKVCFVGQAVSSVLLFLCSLAPNTTALMTILFLNGVALTGALTPVYVLVNEFSPSTIKAKALIITACFTSLANLILPGLAWLVLPLDLAPLNVGFIAPWRLYMAILTIPMLMALLFLWKVPESPKFLLNEGKAEETLEVLKTIYAVNNKKSKSEFPVLSVVLDSSDEGYGKGNENDNPLLRSMKQMWSRTRLLFSRQFILYTTVSCILLFTEVGTFYTFLLWFPDQLSRIKHYSRTHDVYNVTLCDLMSSNNSPAEDIPDCQLNYDFFSYCIMLGIVQIVFGTIVSLYVDKANKKLILACFFTAAGGCISMMVFLAQEYLTIGSLAFTIIVDGMGFPLIIAFIMELYPTYARSTANSVAIIFGRLGASIGNQLTGMLYQNYCEHTYFGISGILIGTAMLCLVLPSKRKL